MLSGPGFAAGPLPGPERAADRRLRPALAAGLLAAEALHSWPGHLPVVSLNAQEGAVVGWQGGGSIPKTIRCLPPESTSEGFERGGNCAGESWFPPKEILPPRAARACSAGVRSRARVDSIRSKQTFSEGGAGVSALTASPWDTPPHIPCRAFLERERERVRA